MCAIFGIYNRRKAAELTMIGLHGNQHRATDFAGIASSDGENIYLHTGAGLARQVFDNEDVLNSLHGRHALGHLRYPTAQKQEGDKYRSNMQPIVGHYQGKEFALAHNGNLTNTFALHALLGKKPMKTTMDSEYIVALIEKLQTGNIVEDLKKVFALLKGSYCLGILFQETLVAVRDPSGCHPISIGKDRDGDALFISSETCAFSGPGARFMRELEPGEIVCIDYEGITSYPFGSTKPNICRFELNYFSHPSSTTFGYSVTDYRKNLGRLLEEHCPALGAEIVVPIPDSARFIGMGYAQSGRSGTYEEAIVRNHYVGRSFIQESQVKRDTTVANKFNFTGSLIEGKKLAVVDDSIVRGTTLLKIVAELRQHGAKEIHLRSASPPIKHPCRYGIDMPTYEELISTRMPAEELCHHLGADSLQFLPLGIQKKMAPAEYVCHACMDGEYWD
jgi:amidophosphoribosyltransferase